MAYALPHEVEDFHLDIGSRRRRRREALRRKHAAQQAAKRHHDTAEQRAAIHLKHLKQCNAKRESQYHDLRNARKEIKQLQQQLRAQQEEIQEVDQALPMEGNMQAELDDFVDIGQRRRRRGVPGVQQAVQRGARAAAAGMPGLAQPAGVFAEGGMFLGLLVVVGIVILASTRR
jgi:chromosome segregation ATPase